MAGATTRPRAEEVQAEVLAALRHLLGVDLRWLHHERQPEPGSRDLLGRYRRPAWWVGVVKDGQVYTARLASSDDVRQLDRLNAWLVEAGRQGPPITDPRVGRRVLALMHTYCEAWRVDE